MWKRHRSGAKVRMARRRVGAACGPTSTKIHQQPLMTGSQSGQLDTSLLSEAVLGDAALQALHPGDDKLELKDQRFGSSEAACLHTQLRRRHLRPASHLCLSGSWWQGPPQVSGRSSRPPPENAEHAGKDQVLCVSIFLPQVQIRSSSLVPVSLWMG